MPSEWLNAPRPYSGEAGYCRIQAFDLNTAEQTLLGIPSSLPSDSFLVSYVGQSQRNHILIDAGKKGQGEQVVIPALLDQGIKRIDQLIISHMHRDHYGGVIDLLEDKRITVDQIFYTPIPEEIILSKNSHSTWKELNQLLQDRAPTVRIVGKAEVGSKIWLNSELCWHIIATPSLNRSPSLGLNDLNIVFKMIFRRFTALFPGDCGIPQAEEILLSEQRDEINDVFFLKAAHHGKGESLSKPMIEKCNARVVLIPSNPHVAEDHRSQLMEHQFDYSANGAKVYRMDHCHGIELFTDGHTVQCESHTQHFRETTTFFI